METIAHARKAAHQGDVVVSLKVNHAPLAIAMEGGHANNEAEHFTPGSSQSNSTNGEGKDEAEHFTPGAH